jgi:hypothetical protein
VALAYPYTDLSEENTNETLSWDHHPGIHNAAAGALNSLKTLLGLNPKGPAASVQARLAFIERYPVFLEEGADVEGEYPDVPEGWRPRRVYWVGESDPPESAVEDGDIHISLLLPEE